MNKSLLILLLLALTSNAYADWEIAGTQKNLKGEAEVIFYKTESLESKNGIIRFWTKSLSDKKIDVEIGNQSKDKKHLIENAQKFNSGYRPKILSVDTRFKRQYKTDKEMSDGVINSIIYEAIANLNKVNPSSQFYWELDCKKSFIRFLDGSLIDEKGNIKSGKQVEDKGRYIAPDSNSEDWKQMFCS